MVNLGLHCQRTSAGPLTSHKYFPWQARGEEANDMGKERAVQEEGAERHQ